jgi:hypothetical protein
MTAKKPSEIFEEERGSAFEECCKRGKRNMAQEFEEVAEGLVEEWIKVLEKENTKFETEETKGDLNEM